MKLSFWLFTLCFSTLAADFNLRNGAPLDCEQDSALPRANVVMVFPGGGGLVDKEKQGVTAILEEILREGPDGMSGDEYKETLFKLNAEIGFRVGARSFQWIFVAPPDKLREVLSLGMKLYREPKLNEKEFLKAKTKVLTHAIAAQDDMMGVVRTFGVRDAFQYTADAKNGGGSPRSVKSITFEEAKAYYAKLMTRQNARFSALTPGSLEEVATDISEILLSGENVPKYVKYAFTRPTAQPYRRTTLKVTIVNKPGATDHQIFYLFPEDVPYDGFDRVNGEVVQYILGGGGFNSRLGETLREKRGLTYYAGSGLGQTLPYWAVMTFGGTDQIAGLLAGIPEVIGKFKKETIPPRLIHNTVVYKTSEHLTSRELPSDRLNERVGANLYGFDPKNGEKVPGYLKQVSFKTMKPFIDRKMDCQTGFLYLMGDKEKLVPILEKRGFKKQDIVIVERDQIL